MTTKTIYDTQTHTVTSCAPTVTNCPAGPHVTVVTVPVTTTVCPVTQDFSVSTVYQTQTYVVTKCPPTVTNCPVGKTTTEVKPTVTVCPVTSAPSGPKSSNAPVVPSPGGSNSTSGVAKPTGGNPTSAGGSKPTSPSGPISMVSQICPRFPCNNTGSSTQAKHSLTIQREPPRPFPASSLPLVSPPPSSSSAKRQTRSG